MNSILLKFHRHLTLNDFSAVTGNVYALGWNDSTVPTDDPDYPGTPGGDPGFNNCDVVLDLTKPYPTDLPDADLWLFDDDGCPVCAVPSEDSS